MKNILFPCRHKSSVSLSVGYSPTGGTLMTLPKERGQEEGTCLLGIPQQHLQIHSNDSVELPHQHRTRHRTLCSQETFSAGAHTRQVAFGREGLVAT